MNPDISNLTISSALEQLRRKVYSALELTETCLHQIARLNADFPVFISPVPDMAVQSAMQADVLYNSRSMGQGDLPLLGIPLGLKDLIALALS